jgi:hypothetical protein
MTKYCVVWSADGFWREDDVKIFENYDSATWFLKLQRQNYSYVKLFEAEVT